MKTFRGPIDGFNNNSDDDYVSDSDDEGGMAMGGQGVFLFDSESEGSDGEEDAIQMAMPGIAGLVAAMVPGIALPHQGHSDSDDDNEDAEDADEVGEGEEVELGTDDEEDAEEEGDDGDGDEEVSEEESSQDAELEQEHVHDVSCSGSSPVLAPSPGPEVEVESDLTNSPVVELHRVDGELDIASRLETQATRLNAETVNHNFQVHQNGGEEAASRSSSELSDLSEPEDTDNNDEPEFVKVNETPTPVTPGTANCSQGLESPRFMESADVTEDEGESNTAYSNPMISAGDEVDSNRNGDTVNQEAGEDDEQFMQLRGDCIGSTTYSERHVLKILMKWMKQIEVIREQDQDGKAELETEFDNELSFLWDMSSEKDVALYLSDKDIFSLLRETLTLTECDRLVEIAIGILVNLLSVPAILHTFPEVETKLQLIPAILSELILCRRIPRLIQSLAFLRRLVWYMSTVDVVETWMAPLTEPDFIQAVNFLLKSCRNIGILSELVTILFMLLEIIRDSHKLLTKVASDGSAKDDGKANEDASGSSSDDDETKTESGGQQPKEHANIGKQNKRIVDEFCKHGLVISLCESLQELLKYPVIDADLWPNTSAGRGDTNEDGLQVIPPNGIQESICLGLNIFEFIHKIKSCREFLGEEAGIIINIYIEFYHRFHLYTQHVSFDAALDHFAEGLKVVGYYQSKLPKLASKAVILNPLAAARKFKQQQEALKREKSEESGAPAGEQNGKPVAATDDLVTSIAVIIHEFLAQLGDKFQLDKIHKIILDEKSEKLARFLEFVNVAVQNIQQKCLQSGNSSDRSFGEDDEQDLTETSAVLVPVDVDPKAAISPLEAYNHFFSIPD